MPDFPKVKTKNKRIKTSAVSPATEETGSFFVKLVSSGILTGILVIGFAAICYGAWLRVKDEVVRSENYRFSSEQIYITELPPWVPTTLLRDVLSNATLHEHETVLVPGLLGDIASAFSTHPWVKEVVQVRLEYPAMVRVDLEYREAVCMVKLPKLSDDKISSEQENVEGYFPVDGEGIYLPTDYFQENVDCFDRFIKIENVKSMPIRPVGHPWGDPAVEQGAEIAALLKNDNHLLQIETISPEIQVKDRTMHLSLRMRTAGHTEIVWGERKSSESDAGKMEQLLNLVHQYGSLDNAPKPIKLAD